MQAILTALTVFFLLSFYFSFLKVRKSGAAFGIIYFWAFWLGSFVWEDLMIFSLYHALASSLSLLFQDVRIGLLMIGVFWIVRACGEALYFFLQQFHLPQHYPHYLHDFLKPMRNIFGDISDQKGYIIMQVLHQSVAMCAATGVILLVMNWQSVPSWW